MAKLETMSITRFESDTIFLHPSGQTFPTFVSDKLGLIQNLGINIFYEWSLYHWPILYNCIKLFYLIRLNLIESIRRAVNHLDVIGVNLIASFKFPSSFFSVIQKNPIAPFIRIESLRNLSKFGHRIVY